MPVCNLCPRKCNTDRSAHRGFCGEALSMRISRAAPHKWEEPCISGNSGSGTVFFSGCSLRCVFCQNAAVSSGIKGREISPEQLSDIFLSLESQGVCNINLVTPSHFTIPIIHAIELAIRQGIKLPFVWNSSGYESVESLRLLDGYIDIFLPDFKYKSPALSLKYSGAEDYFMVACAALETMKNLQRDNIFSNGLMKKGVLVRHLVLPGCTDDSLDLLDYLYDTYRHRIYLSIMNQYTPMSAALPDALSRKLTKEEYNRVSSYALLLGIKNGFFQQGEAASESFIPDFY